MPETHEYVARPEERHAVQDFSRGVWPYRSFRNRAVATGVQDGTLVGINMGGNSQMLDLTFEPVVAHSSRLDLGLLRTGGVCCFGSWRGAIRFDGREPAVRSLVVWAEELGHRW